AEDGIRDFHVTGVQTCALPICLRANVLEQLFPRAWEALNKLREETLALDGDIHAGSALRDDRQKVVVNVIQVHGPHSSTGRGSRDRKSVVEGRSGESSERVAT